MDEELESQAAAQGEEQQAAEPELHAEESGQGEEIAQESVSEDGGIVVTIGDEEPEDHQQAAPWVRELRIKQRELARENRELKERIAAASQQSRAPAMSGPGPEPTLEDCDYDVDRFKSEMLAWVNRKREADDYAARVAQQQQAQQQAWQDRLKGYASAKEALKAPDYDDAEMLIQESMNATQQGIILQGADNPALVVYALGKNAAKAKEMAAINDPVKFAFAIAKLETQLKVQKRGNTAPPPERAVSGTGRTSGAVDSTLERLRKEAERTGDMSAVVKYKREHRKTA